MAPIISIIIPMYNVEKFIERCILSCVNQDLSQNDYEIICINDGSPDNTNQIVEGLAIKYSNIKVFTRPNGGLSAARNTGLEYATGEYVFFVDGDDWIESNCLRKIADKLGADHPDVLCICAADVLGDHIRRRMDFSGYQATSGPDSMLRYSSPCAPFQIVSKAHLDNYHIRFYEGIYHEDVEYTPRMRYLASNVCYLNDIVYYVYQNPASITRTVNIKKVYDVLTVVVPRIQEFTERFVESKYRPCYNTIIASAINTVLSRNSPLLKEDKRRINKIMSNNRYVYEAYCRSTLGRYKIEGYLFKMFPNHAVDVFSLFCRRNLKLCR